MSSARLFKNFIQGSFFTEMERAKTMGVLLVTWLMQIKHLFHNCVTSSSLGEVSHKCHENNLVLK